MDIIHLLMYMIFYLGVKVSDIMKKISIILTILLAICSVVFILFGDISKFLLSLSIIIVNIYIIRNLLNDGEDDNEQNL